MTQLSEEDLFRLMSNSRRRAVIKCLADEQDTTARDLSVHIACEEYGYTPESLPGRARQRVYIALTQGHLTQLDDPKVIEYDDQSKVVGRGPEYETALDAIRSVNQVLLDESATVLGRIRGFSGGAANV